MIPTSHILTLTIFSPLIGIALISLVPRKFEEGVRVIAFSTTLLTAALTCLLWMNFKAAPGFMFQEMVPWVASLNINYHLGIDGTSLLLIALTSVLTPLCVAISWNEIKDRRKEFYALILACQIGLTGVFASLDLFLFYVFWEVMLVPMYLLIGIWGSGNRVYVALKFLLFTMVGSVLMLVGLIYLYLVSGKTFNMLTLGTVAISPEIQLWLFLSFAIAFAIKVPVFPFHTWLPDAHTEAPTAGSVLLAGVFLKVGAYGFYRIAMPFFPDAVAMARPYIFYLAVISIVYGALVSMVQTDLKRLIAYSSVSHLGFVMLGLISLNQEGAQGAVLQMVNHGFSTGALFILFGMLYSRVHTRNIDELHGIARSAPLYSGFFIFTGLSSLGLPGLNNFVGEILTLLGAFKVEPVLAIISASGVVFAAVYILWAVHRVFFGPSKSSEDGSIKDVSLREAAIFLPLFIAIIWLGVYPKTALSKISYSTSNFIWMSKRAIIEEPKPSIDVMIPEIKKRLPKWILPEQIPESGRMGYPEATGVMEPWNREEGKAPDVEGLDGSDREFGLDSVPSGSGADVENPRPLGEDEGNTGPSPLPEPKVPSEEAPGPMDQGVGF